MFGNPVLESAVAARRLLVPRSENPISTTQIICVDLVAIKVFTPTG